MSIKCRPCLVNGKKALFHRWVDKDRLIYKFDSLLSQSAIKELNETFNTSHVVPNWATPSVIKTFGGLVEFEDGAIKDDVKPSDIRFLDSGNLFYENDIFFREEN